MAMDCRPESNQGGVNDASYAVCRGRRPRSVPPPIPNPGPSAGTPFLTIVQGVCAVVGVAYPTTVFGSLQANRTMQEMVNLGNEMARRIAYDTREWTVLRKQQIYYGDGTTTAFNLPADFKRMLLTSNVYGSASTQSPLRFISDPDEWMQRRNAGNTDSYGEWTIMGGQMHIWPALAYGATARFAYLEKNCIVRAPTTRSPTGSGAMPTGTGSTAGSSSSA